MKEHGTVQILELITEVILEKMAKNLTKHAFTISREQREINTGHPGRVLWFTGLSGSGKSTIANALDEVLHGRGLKTYILDGDNVRMGLNGDLGFSPEDRKENIRRIAEVAKLFADSGTIVLTAFISPYIEDRDAAREVIGDDFVEVFVDTPLDVCEDRDPKGLYKKARAGEIKGFTGIDAPYEAPKNPEFTLNNLTINESVNSLIDYLDGKSLLSNIKEINTLDKQKTLSFDFDGVIHKYSKGFQGLENAYDVPMPGAREVLTQLKDEGYILKVMSSRPAHVIKSWLFDNMMDHLFEDVSNQKFAATVYVDDRAMYFDKNNPDWNKTYDEIKSRERKTVTK